jgi:hypothetical protein
MAFAMNEVSSFGFHHIVLLPFKIKMYVVRIKTLTMHARPSRTVSTAKSLVKNHEEGMRNCVLNLCDMEVTSTRDGNNHR